MKYDYSVVQDSLRITDKKTRKIMPLTREIALEMEDMLSKHISCVDHGVKTVTSPSEDMDETIRLLAAYLEYKAVLYHVCLSMEEYMAMGQSRPDIWTEKGTNTVWRLSYDYTYHLTSLEQERRQLSLHDMYLLDGEELWRVSDWVINGCENGESPCEDIVSGKVYQTDEGRAVVVKNREEQVVVLSASIIAEGIEEWFHIRTTPTATGDDYRKTFYYNRAEKGVYATRTAHCISAILSVSRQYFKTAESKALLGKPCLSNKDNMFQNLMLHDQWDIVGVLSKSSRYNVSNILTDAGEWITHVDGYHPEEYPCRMRNGVVLFKKCLNFVPLEYKYEGIYICIPTEAYRIANITQRSIGIASDGEIYFVKTKTEVKKLGSDYYKEYCLFESTK